VARRLDSAVGRVFGQMQDLRAECEEGRATLAKIQAAGIELSEQRDQLGCCATFVGGCALDFGKQRLIGDSR
jgi:hypothetical protein